MKAAAVSVSAGNDRGSDVWQLWPATVVGSFKSKRRWPRLSTNGGGENGRVTPVNVLCFKPRQLLSLLQAHNFMPLKVPKGEKSEWRRKGGRWALKWSSCRVFLPLVLFMPDSLPLSCWKLLAFLESIKTSWGFKVIIKSIMLAWITRQSLSVSPRLSRYAMRRVGVGCRCVCKRVCIHVCTLMCIL